MNSTMLIQKLEKKHGINTSSIQSQAFFRFIESLKPCLDYHEISDSLNPKAAYIGPGKWLDTIQQIYRSKT